MQFLRRGESAGRVVGQQRRYLQRYPPVHAIGPVVNGSKKIGGLGEVFQRQIEKERLTRFSFCKTCADRKAAIPALQSVGGDRAIAALKKARYRMRGGVLGIGDSNTNACLKSDAERAIQALGGTLR